MQDTESTYVFEPNEVIIDKKTFGKLRSFHLAQISFRLTLFIFFASLLLVTSGFLTFVLSAIVMLLGFALIVMTLGYILIVSPNFLNSLTNFTDGSSAVGNFIFSLFNYMPYIISIGMLACIVTIISLKVSNQQKRHKSMLIFSIVTFVIFAIILTFVILNIISATKGVTA